MGKKAPPPGGATQDQGPPYPPRPPETAEERRARRAKNAARTVQARITERRVLEYHLKGLTGDEIAEKMGWKFRSTAHKVLKRALDRIVLPTAEEVRKMDLELSFKLQKKLLPMVRKRTVEKPGAEGPYNMMEEPDVRAAEAVVKLMQHRGKMFGTLSEGRELTGKGGGPLEVSGPRGGVVFRRDVQQDVYEPEPVVNVPQGEPVGEPLGEPQGDPFAEPERKDP